MLIMYLVCPEGIFHSIRKKWSK